MSKKREGGADNGEKFKPIGQEEKNGHRRNDKKAKSIKSQSTLDMIIKLFE